MTNRDPSIALGYLLGHEPTASAELADTLGWESERASAALDHLGGVGLLDHRAGLVSPSQPARAFDALDVI